MGTRVTGSNVWKALAQKIIPELQQKKKVLHHDSSNVALIELFKE